MTSSHLASYVAEQRAKGVPWDHVANMAGCSAADLLAFRSIDTGGAAPAPEPAVDLPAAAPRRARKTGRRGPGGLLLAVLLAIGDGYGTSLRIATLLDTSIDNVNGALGRLEMAGHTARASGPMISPVVWMATDAGMKHLRQQMAEGFD